MCNARAKLRKEGKLQIWKAEARNALQFLRSQDHDRQSDLLDTRFRLVTRSCQLVCAWFEILLHLLSSLPTYSLVKILLFVQKYSTNFRPSIPYTISTNTGLCVISSLPVVIIFIHFLLAMTKSCLRKAQPSQVEYNPISTLNLLNP